MSFYSVYSFNSFDSNLNAQDENSSFLSFSNTDSHDLNLNSVLSDPPLLEDSTEYAFVHNYGLNICCWNIHGLASKLKNDTNLFFSFLNTFSIFILVETWIKSDFDHFGITSRLSNFDLFWLYATQNATMGRAKGGMLIGCKKELSNLWKYDCYGDIPFFRHNNTNLFLVPVYISPIGWESIFDTYLNFFSHFELNKFFLSWVILMPE